MDNVTPDVRGLTPAQIEQFIIDGFVCIDRAFPRALADAARAILWNAIGCSPDDPTTWTQPVAASGHRPVVTATGDAGTVYLCQSVPGALRATAPR
jgi:hypothetical protein